MSIEGTITSRQMIASTAVTATSNNDKGLLGGFGNFRRGKPVNCIFFNFKLKNFYFSQLQLLQQPLHQHLLLFQSVLRKWDKRKSMIPLLQKHRM